MSAAQPPTPTPSRARDAGAAGGKVAMWQAFGFLCAYLWKKFDPSMPSEIQVVVAQFFGAAGLAVHQYVASGGGGGEPPLRSSLPRSLALVALVAIAGGCLSYDPGTAARLASEHVDATELSTAECQAFRDAAAALQPRDGRDGPETTWKGPLGLEDELERAAAAARHLANTCDRAVDPATPNVPFADLARAYSDAWCAVLELTTDEGCNPDE